MAKRRCAGAGRVLPERALSQVHREHCALAATPAGPACAMRQMEDAKRRSVVHNGLRRARLRAKHSPMTRVPRSLWAAVQSNEVYLTL